ncbi:uncharacterized protein DUF3858 [Tenacibaculum skagerrakense]|uniref:Uncharacterized protein DUF3858 n=1 Tax=Tenacibaculum skagerrakense TaxID=186571 RepID=A0A4R2NPD1_9FLAO|nr:DUF3857 domain-containing protein [Tenacibaculum skagerrakense]TCP23610.1 uncharacterized protein DUF3858 [Tenacibaculum skagerrakense]
MITKIAGLPLLLFFINISISFAQDMSLMSLTLSPELTKDANAVIRESYTEITVEAVDEMIVKERRVTTVLNKLGNKHVDAYASYDNDTKITDLSATVYNSLGKEIKKYSKSKFTDVSAVDGGTLYSDSRVKYIDHTPTEYPYTVVFEKEYKTSSTGFIPKWYPLDSYYVSVQKSEYKIINLENIETRIKENNFDGYSIKRVNEDKIHYVAENLPAIEYEDSSISISEILPNLIVALNQFTLKGIKGSAKNWEEFGKWRFENLKNGNDILSESVKYAIQQKVKGAKSNIEKAKIVYDFMQNRTRYISVQEGIGGWKPIPADEVHKMGYGDCKGLTNYTKALLDAVDVKSHYSVVWAGSEKKNMIEGFSSMQGNHVILNIPNDGNDIWLECTSQTMPFGFLGDFTDDRDVLVITPEGGLIKRTPSYKNETNLQTCKASIQLNEKGSLEADVEITSKGVQYDDKYGIESLAKDDLEKYYKSKLWSYINNLEIKSSSLENDKDNIVFKEKLHVNVADYASITANELIVRVNVFNKNTFVPKRYRTRNHPLQINRGYKDVDEFTFTIPNGYKITSLPSKVEISTKFGNYTMEVKKVDEKTISYHKTLFIKEGIYPKEDYKLYRQFRKRIAKQESVRIALQKVLN